MPYLLTCPDCQFTEEVPDLGEYPWSWQLWECRNCGKMYSPAEQITLQKADHFSYGDYTAKIDPDNTVTVFYLGEEVWRSRAFRLRVQAEAQMKDFVNNAIGKAQEGDITLDVQSLSIDPDALFGGK